MADAKLSRRDSKRVVYVGDESGLNNLHRPEFESGGRRFTVEIVGSISTALDTISDQLPDCILLDCRQPGHDEFEFLRRIRDEQPELPIISIIDAEHENVGSKAIRAGTTDCLHKDLVTDQHVLTTRIENVMTNQQSEHQTNDRLNRLNRILKTVPTAVTQANRQGEIIFANQHAQEHLGVEPSEVTDRTYNDPQWEITDVDGNPLPDDELPFNRVMNTGESVRSFQHNIIWPDGRSRTVEVNGSPLYDEEGDVESVVFSTVDVTEQQKRVKKIEQYKEYLNNSPDVIHVLAEDGTVEYQSDTSTQGYGFDLQEISGENPSAVIHPDDQEQVQCDFEQVLASGPEKTINTEFRVETEDGEYHWFENRTTNYLNHEPIDGILVTSRNIDDRKAREAELESKQSFTKQALDSLNDLFYVLDTDGTVRRWNQQVVDMTGYTPEEIDGMTHIKFIDSSQEKQIKEAFEEALQRGEATTEANLRTKDGNLIPYNWSSSQLTNTDGETIGVVGIGRDISEQKNKQAKLDHTQQQLKTVLSNTNTGVWTLDADEDSITSAEMPDGIGLDHESNDIESYLAQIHPDDRTAVEDAVESAIDGEGKFDTQFRLADDAYERWLRAHGTAVRGNGGSLKIVGVTSEVTERVHRTKALQKREQVLQKLHDATQQLYTASRRDDVAEIVISLLEDSLDLDYVSLTLFAEESGTLQSVASTPQFDELTLSSGAPSSHSNPIWETYRTGKSRTVTGEALDQLFDNEDSGAITQLLAVPLGDIGVVLVCYTGGTQRDTVDTDLIDIITANATAAFNAIATAEKRTELADQLATQQMQTNELQQMVEATQSVQKHISRVESRSEMYETVCSELIQLTNIDFVWVGRPQATGESFDITASAGGGMKYIDTIFSGHEVSRSPAQIAAETHEKYVNNSIAEDVPNECWAKEAISAGYQSVHSVPITRDEVVYDVITVYASSKDRLIDAYETMLTNIGSIITNYAQMMDQQQQASDNFRTVVTFNFSDDSYPLQQLADRSDSEIYFDTIVRNTEQAITLIVEVVAGDRQSVPKQADNIAKIKSATLIGTDDSQRVLVEIERPCRINKISKHGGQIVNSISAPENSEICIQLKDGASTRPLLDFITSQFDSAELIAKEDIEKLDLSDTDPTDSLTDRQLEIVSAAYHGGYYETPREINGEDLAESFGISSPVIYNHLQAAHRKILTGVIGSESVAIKNQLDS